MSIGITKRIRRAIMAALRPLTGDRATGNVLVKAATGYGGIVLPRLSFGVPVVLSATGAGQLSHDLPLFTTSQAVLTEAGVSVPVTSLLGGARHNLANGTVIRWDPPLLGVESTATLTAAMADGADSTSGPGLVRQCVAFETFSSVQAAQDVFLARASRSPALVLAWAGSPSEQSTGAGASRREDTWKLYVICGSQKDGIVRIDEALDILDAVETYLLDRSSADGFVFTAPPIRIRSRELVKSTQTSTIYSMTFTTSVGITRTEHRSIEAGDFADWLRLQIDVDTATPLPMPVVDEAEYPMGRGLSRGFSDGFASGGD